MKVRRIRIGMGRTFLSCVELFKEDDDEAMYKNPYEIRLCDLISVSLATSFSL